VAAEGELPLARTVLTRAERDRGVLDRLFNLAVVACLGITVLVLLAVVHGHAILPAVDLALDTISLVVSLALTALAWARFRERRVTVAAYHAAAFLALAVAYAIAVAVSLGQGDSMGSLAQPENVQVLVFAVARLAAASFFVVGGMFTRRPTYGQNPVGILAAPALAVLLAAVLGALVGTPPDALQILRFTNPSGLPDTTPFGAALHLVTGALFFIGAWASRAQWRAGVSVIDGWIAIGLVFAGFAELHWTLYPSAHPGQVSVGDLLLLASSISLLLGLESAVRANLRELQGANLELAELRESDLERVALEERTRLARELHDGLAQDLWLAKLRTGELASMEGLPVEARRAVQDAVAAIDVGLGEAREAVAALRSSAHADSGFCSLVRRTVEDYGDRFGLRVEFAFEGEHDARIAPRTQAEVLRIAQEALTNVARHANATVVGVRLAVTGDRITLRVADNGRGFDAAAARKDSYGLTTMRERAAIIGGHLRIASSAGAGTRVVLTAPFVRPAAVAEPEPS